jgi:hypothetical protein
MIVDVDKLKDIEIEIKLHINQRLYEKGLITAEMYTEAKNYIITS